MLDEDELCVDLCNGALVCWGTLGPDRDMRAGMPWEMRSWEPQVWFLRKYWFLVGGWEDEMWRSVRWWHGVRGEKIEGI